MNREKSYRRHQEISHMWRRLKEDRNQHYEDLSCPCWTDVKAMARFKEQPKNCSCHLCCNVRRRHGTVKQKLTISEMKNLDRFREQMRAQC